MKFLVRITSEYQLKVISLIFGTEIVGPCLVWKLQWLPPVPYKHKIVFLIIFFIDGTEGICQVIDMILLKPPKERHGKISRLPYKAFFEFVV